jgi:regulator of sigma E protease
MQALQDILIYGGSFVLVLSVVVFVHEFGHFQVGRWCGVAVKSFSIGLGSEWFGWTDKHGTRWKVSKIPLGGFVSWVDDTDGSSTRPATETDAALSVEEARRLGHFRAMPVWKRAAATAAGPLANFVFAILAFATIFLIDGRRAADIDAIPARIAEVSVGSAAANAGLQASDVIVSVDGVATPTFPALQSEISSSGGRTVTLSVLRGDETLSLAITPRRDGERLVLGVRGPAVLPEEVTVRRFGPISAIGEGATETWRIIAQTGTYLGGVLSGRESGNQIAGPLGIINVSGQVASSALDAPATDFGDTVRMLILSLVGLMAVLSVAVGIVNLLPIPVLDGGHLVFYAIEALRGGKPLPPQAQEWAYRAGFAAIASLFLFATWNDITRLFPGAQ